MRIEPTSPSSPEGALHGDYIEHWLQRAASLLSEERPEAVNAIEKALSFLDTHSEPSLLLQARTHHLASRIFGFVGRIDEAFE